MKITGIQRLEDTVVRVDSVGDNWHMSWANDDRQYVSLCDGTGFPNGMPRLDYNSRALAIAGDPPNGMRFDDLRGYPELVNVWKTREWSRYYNFGILALDGSIYQYLSTPNHPFSEPAPTHFIGAKLIYSPDNGKTWHNQDGSTPVVWEPWESSRKEKMCFFEEPGESFALITVLQYGKNYQYNTDGYVYLYSPNGNADGSMNQLVLARVKKDHILHRDEYEFFAGAQPDGSQPRWSKRIEDRGIVATFPTGWVNEYTHPYAWHPSVVYYPATKQYLMANWGMATDHTKCWFTRPSYLGFWTSPNPWGPWTQVHEETAWTPGNDKNARAYQPQIAPKWISPDGKSFWLVWTDFQTIDGKAPYYAFNLQKVAVTIA